jgi:hypothetical protein
VVVIDSTWETLVTNAINQPIGVVAKLNAIAKIHKYRGLHEKHHFIPITIEVHGALECDMNHFIKEHVCIFYDR